MKRPEYVAAAVTACREAREGKTPDMERLRAVFSRSGFTDGYLTGRRTPEMFGYRRREDVTAADGVFGELAGLYKTERQSLPVDMRLTLTDSLSRLDASCGGDTVSVTGDAPQPARTRPTDREAALKSLEKTGGTPFFLRSLETEIEGNVMLPVAALNALRRAALDALLEARGRTAPHVYHPVPVRAYAAHQAADEPVPVSYTHLVLLPF